MKIISRVNSYLDLLRFYSGVFPPAGTVLKGINAFFTGRASFPVTVDILVTDVCNLFCDMCYSSERYIPGSNKGKDILTLDEISKFLEECSSFRPVIHFGGGEPFSREDMTKIILEVKNKGMKCLVTTNGTLLNRNKVKDLLDTGVDGIIVSLYGDKEIHDSITGFKGAFERVQDAIMNIKENKNKDQKLYVSSIIRPEYLNSIEPLVSRVYAMGVDGMKMEHLNFISRKDYEGFLKEKRLDVISSYVEEKTFRHEDGLNIIGVMKRVKKKYGRFVLFKPGLSDRQVLNWYVTGTHKGQVCFFRRHSAVINYNGEVIPCQFLPGIVMGNIKEDKFSDIWKRTFKDRKQSLSEYYPVCQRCCKG